MNEQVIGQIRVNKSATFLYHNTSKSVSFEVRWHCVVRYCQSYLEDLESL